MSWGIFRPHVNRWCFFNVNSHCVTEEGGTSQANPGGINAIATSVRGLLQYVPASEIAVVSIYRFDRDKMQKALKAVSIRNVECGTVDSFEGQEKSIIILHFVATGGPDNPFGFVRDKLRLCVGLSRSMRYLFMFGNLTYWNAHKANWSRRKNLRYMKQLIETVDDRNGPIARVQYPANKIIDELAANP
ncbi:hypothetical protein H2201_001558 [Coniosporium apollinis]|uniref:DNA2/NAM7 helicase-like C-terminal domain-containing protein n=1 Tax=Coniosporium apollinis TaxID=61459 RepID=A0ABQ9P1S0_9PEZI|nr:hypothetical protein H2201_001558 [Coniosporium apollinis]